MLGEYQSKEHERLRAFATKYGTRPDWHEPDEQEISARVIGTRLDNACGAAIDGGALREGYQEIVVILTHSHPHEQIEINLADLLALACAKG